MTYYKQIQQIQVAKIPIKLKLKDWIYLVRTLLYYAAPEPDDDFIQSCWRAAIVQIIIKIGKKEQKQWQGLDQEKQYTIQLTPTEKYTLEELLYNERNQDIYLSTVFYQIKLQLEQFDSNRKHFDSNKKRITSSN